MARNVKLQIFITPEFYLKLAQEARNYSVKARSDSELVQNLISFYQNKILELTATRNKMEERILSLNNIIQEKEAAIHAYAMRKKKVKKA